MGKKDIYEALWSRFGKRMWTYILRDLYHEYELAVFLIWFWLGIGVYYQWGFKGCGYFSAILCLGYLLGHLFWGTKWRKGQR
jgi:hypothetical protein